MTRNARRSNAARFFERVRITSHHAAVAVTA
jgi:hypothetical protein